MKLKDTLHLPKLADLGEFGRAEFANGIAEIRDALITEAWFDRSTSSATHVDRSPLGWELPDDTRDRASEDPFGSRWSAADQTRSHAEKDHPHELDFDR